MRTLATLGLAILVAALSAGASAQPANDNRAAAIALVSGVTVNSTNVAATTEAGEVVPSCQTSFGATVWYSYTAPAAGFVSVSTLESAFDTILTLHNPDGTQLSPAACNDDINLGGGITESALNAVSVTAGQQFLVRVAGFGTVPATGAFSLTLSFIPVPFVTMATGTTAGAPTTTRPTSVVAAGGNPCTLSTTDTAVRYSAVPIQFVTRGVFRAEATVTGPHRIYVYRGAFNPAAPCTNLYAFSGVGQASTFINGLVLDAGTPYTFVVMANANTVAGGDYTLQVIGPGLGAVAGEDGPGAGATALRAARPNPSAGHATLELAVASAQRVTVEAYDLLGRRVATLYDGPVAAGTPRALTFDAAGLPAGVYVVRATGETFSETQRVTVAR